MSKKIKKGVINALSRCGGTWLTREQASELAKRLRVSEQSVYNDADIVVYEKYGWITLKEIAKIENEIAYNLMRLSRTSVPRKTDETTIRCLVKKFEKEENDGYELHYHQVDAVIMTVNSSLSILTGGPGTGKTTVLRAIAYVLRQLYEGIEISYAAPTGKAARRCTESTGEYACTGHKKLGLGRDGENCAVNPIGEDVLFMDESSMNDIYLTKALSEAIQGQKRLVFVGDIDQLPSVGLGAVLRDIIASGVVPVTMLTHTFRQDNSSVLFKNICKVREGKSDFIRGKDFNPIKLEGTDITNRCIREILVQYKKSVNKYGMENTVCLLPYRRERGSKCCSNFLNNEIQKVINPQKTGFRHTDKDGNVRIFKLNDPVMQLVNRTECANGDVGKVIEVSQKGVVVQYTEDTVEYSPSDLNEIALAYAMSIHKSQGSEYSCVIMALLDEHVAMLQRNLIYTGITRAKKECVVMYEQKALDIAVNTIAEDSRNTLLAEKMQCLDAQYRLTYGLGVA